MEAFIISIDVACATLAVLVQAIIYPTLRHIDREQFPTYHTWYMRQITWIVGPLMVLQVIGHAYLIVQQPDLLNGLSAFLVLLTWAITGVEAVPLHARLSRDGQDQVVLTRLLRVNLNRTVCWVLIVPLWLWM